MEIMHFKKVATLKLEIWFRLGTSGSLKRRVPFGTETLQCLIFVVFLNLLLLTYLNCNRNLTLKLISESTNSFEFLYLLTRKYEAMRALRWWCSRSPTSWLGYVTSGPCPATIAVIPRCRSCSARSRMCSSRRWRASSTLRTYSSE